MLNLVINYYALCSAVSPFRISRICPLLGSLRSWWHHSCSYVCLPRSEKYRSAVEEDVAAKLTDVTAARDALRSHMDESKDGGVRGLDQIRLYRWQGFLTLCILSSAIHYIFGSVVSQQPFPCPSSSSSHESTSHICFIDSKWIPWQDEMLVPATETLKRALNELEKAMGPVKKLKASKAE